MNKELIQSRFSKNLASYNEHAKIQKRMAEKLISFAEKKEYNSILEIGCGTGFLTKNISERISFNNYKAIDIVPECKKYISEINTNIEFIADDIENYLNKSEKKYDLIISNASLQWVNDFENTITSLKNSLNNDGELIFSTFGKENFREIYHAIGTSLNYYSQKELQNMFKIFQISSEEEIHIMSFATPKDVLKHLQATGVNAVESVSWTKKDLIKFENAYSNLCSKRPTLTYNPIYVKIK